MSVAAGSGPADDSLTESQGPRGELLLPICLALRTRLTSTVTITAQTIMLRRGRRDRDAQRAVCDVRSSELRDYIEEGSVGGVIQISVKDLFPSPPCVGE